MWVALVFAKLHFQRVLSLHIYSLLLFLHLCYEVRALRCIFFPPLVSLLSCFLLCLDVYTIGYFCLEV
uniref:Uncharacterized protein n=1 Tax=Ixodes scapularis TaxID=6945 RepID=A0A4D5RE64_IXOSC